jgi:uncharacterized repeat protein (TIGR02543 family)
MKKRFLTALYGAVLCAGLFTGCKDLLHPDGPKEWVITFDLDGGNIDEKVTAHKVSVRNGDSVGSAIPSNPAKDGYAFGGWHTEKNGGGNQFTSSTAVTADKTVYAKWTVAQYTITFDTDGGSINGDTATQTRLVNNGAALGANMPSEPTKDGYAFGGWYTEKNGGETQFTHSTPVTTDITVYAKWMDPWTVTFNLDGGNIDGSTAAQTRLVNNGSSLGANMPVEPTKSGYIFDGWYTPQDEDPFTSATPVSADITVHAKWAIPWTVTFELDGGSVNGDTAAQTRLVKNDGSLGANMPSEPTKSGCVFDGWFTLQNGAGARFDENTPVTANRTVYAKWAIQRIVTFNLDGGNIAGNAAVQTRTAGDGISLGANMPSEPIKSGYAFSGWFTLQNGAGTQFTYSTVVSADITVYAKWTIQRIVTFNLDGGNIEGDTAAQTRTVGDGASLGANMPSNPTKSGNTFSGWHTSLNGGGNVFSSTMTISADITVYAEWTVTITFELDGGNVGGDTTAQTRIINSGVSLGVNMPSEPVKSGTAFGGWFTLPNGEGTRFTSSTAVSVNITVYAKWTAQRIVTFELDGGNVEGNTVAQTRTAGDGVSLGVNMPSEPTKNGYAFDGWYTSRNGGGTQFTSSTVVTANITIYAKWGAQRTVTFELDGGNIAGDTAAQTRTVGDGASLGSTNMPSEPVKSGYAFDGWYTSRNGGGTQFTFSTAVTADITVYAKWTVTVTFNLGGGTIDGSTAAQTRTVGDGASLGSTNMPSEPIKSGYAFDGWYTLQNGGGTRFTSSTAVSADITVYAKWIAQWTITFDLDGGTIEGSGAAQTRFVIDGASLGADMPSEPINSGWYAFEGWYTSQGGEGTQFAPSMTITANMTVYAKWTAITTLVDSLIWLKGNAVQGGDYTITVQDDEMMGPQTLSYGGKNVNITLIGGDVERWVVLNSNGSLFIVENGVTLTLDNNITLQGKVSNNASLVRVNSGGTLLVKDGAKISGNTNNSNDGGGVVVSGTFTMSGGAISGNLGRYSGGVYVTDSGTFEMNGGIISGNTTSNDGGGVFIFGGGIFTMNSGTINDNRAGIGGGVYLRNSGIFEMNGGTVSGNTASNAGGGVFISTSGTFTMNNGAINNDNRADRGGGVFINGIFKMVGGTVSGNLGRDGGGVFMDGGTFTMRGGVISGNTASSAGGGVYVYSGTFVKLSSSVIYGSNAAESLKNTARDSYGHAVYAGSSKKRDITAGSGVNMNSDVSGSAGGWE